MSKTDDQLRSEIDANESRGEWGAWAVVGGLVLEIVFATAKSFGYEHPQIENWGAVIADCFIALGVYAEIHFGRKASRGNAELRRRSDEKVAEANARAAEAELRTERLKSELAWRRLTSENIAKISAVLERHGKFCLRIMFVGDDTESNAFAHDLGKVFSKNGWQVLFISCSFHGEIPFGMRIPLWEPPDLEAVAIIRTAISEAGLEYTGHDLPSPFSPINA